VKVGILICWDNNLVENVRATALLGADILLAPHQTGGTDSRSPHAMKRIPLALWEERETRKEEITAAFKGPAVGNGSCAGCLPVPMTTDYFFFSATVSVQMMTKCAQGMP
jgi:hypothetical protein